MAQGFFNPYILRIMRQLLGVEGLVLGRQTCGAESASEEMDTRDELGGEAAQEGAGGARSTNARAGDRAGDRARLHGAYPIQIRVPRPFWAHCA